MMFIKHVLQKAKELDFFVKIPYKPKELPILITNNYVVDKNDIDINIKIELQLNNGKIMKILQIDK